MQKIKTQLFELKKAYKKDNIFIYQCLGPGGCSGHLMMHQRVCPHCNLANAYFNESLAVSDQLDKEVS